MPILKYQSKTDEVDKLKQEIDSYRPFGENYSRGRPAGPKSHSHP